MFIVSLVSHFSFSQNEKCKCVQSIYTWGNVQNKRLYAGAVLPWVTVALGAAVRRSAANPSLGGSHKNAKHFHRPPPFKETDGRTAWSQPEPGDEACPQTPECSFCPFHSISSFFCVWDKPVRGNIQQQHVLDVRWPHLVWDRSCQPPPPSPEQPGVKFTRSVQQL